MSETNELLYRLSELNTKQQRRGVHVQERERERTLQTRWHLINMITAMIIRRVIVNDLIIWLMIRIHYTADNNYDSQC